VRRKALIEDKTKPSISWGIAFSYCALGQPLHFWRRLRSFDADPNASWVSGRLDFLETRGSAQLIGVVIPKVS
jgi:hypothetical protein